MKYIQVQGSDANSQVEPYLIGCVFEVVGETHDLYIINKETKRYPDAIRKDVCVVLDETLAECEPYIRLLLARTRITLEIYQVNDNDELYKRLTTLENALATRWIPVEEALPTEQGHYLVKVKYSFPKNCNVLVAEFYDDRETFYCECNEKPLKDVTHWRGI
jgi:hypothetical protein